MRHFYLVAAILGAIIPILFFSEFFSSASTLEFIPALFVNGASAGFTSDLLISSFVFWAYMFNQQKEAPKPWLFIVLNLCIGLSCALPAYLYTVERNKTGSSH